MTYKLTDKCPKQVILQSLPSGDYDYSQFESLKAAWDAEQLEPWVQDELKERDLDEIKEEFLATLDVYTPDQTLEAAEAGYSWPITWGYVTEIEELEGEENDE
jgi:hypothetical protein